MIRQAEKKLHNDIKILKRKFVFFFYVSVCVCAFTTQFFNVYYLFLVVVTVIYGSFKLEKTWRNQREVGEEQCLCLLSFFEDSIVVSSLFPGGTVCCYDVVNSSFLSDVGQSGAFQHKILVFPIFIKLRYVIHQFIFLQYNDLIALFPMCLNLFSKLNLVFKFF